MYLRCAALWGEGQRLVREVNGCGAQLQPPSRGERNGEGAVMRLLPPKKGARAKRLGCGCVWPALCRE